MTIIPIRDVSLYVEVHGQGYPLVLMHGGPGLDYTSLLELKHLADQFTLIFYDHRCNGRSVGPDVTSMTWDNLTADADALRQELGYEKWAVLGHSFGGNVALEYALRYPQNLSHLILMNTSGDAWWPQHNAAELLRKRGYSPAAVEACRRFFNGQLKPEEVTPTVFKFGKAYFYHISYIFMVYYMLFGPKAQRRGEAHVFGFGTLLPGWTVMDRLKDIKTPTLVIAGRHDFLYPPECEAILADRLPNAQLELIEFAGHNPHDEQPAVTLPIIRRFLT
jgi:proline iminopeptidase